MTHAEISKALIALSTCRVGIREAALLFCAAGGATAEGLAGRTGCPLGITRARIQTLRNKRLLAVTYQLDRSALYAPSRSGLQIINSVTHEDI